MQTSIPQNKAIQVFAMGGTIDKIYFDALSEYQVGQPQVPGIFKNAGLSLDIQIQSICSKDSLEITEQDRNTLLTAVLNTKISHILVTHGTDTMALSAQYIQAALSAQTSLKTIVFVGSMNPACFKESDAPFNVGFALGVLQAAVPGVYLAMNGQIFNPNQVRKNRTAFQFEAIPATNAASDNSAGNL